MTDHESSANVPADWGRGYGRLTGHTALVTGSTRGLGRTMAEWLAREGANIIVSGREQADVDAAVSGIRQTGVEAWGIPADLSRVEDAHALAEASFARTPAPSIVINNAGMSIPQHFWEASDADFDYEMNVNLRSPFILCQHAVRAWMGSGTHGRIVNVSTIGVFQGHRDRVIYNMAKSGVQAMTRNLSYEAGQFGITVNCIAPGAVPDKPGSNWQPQDDLPASGIPFKRYGRAEDIAAAVIYFCLPESEWTNGQTLLVDGGHISCMHG
ncbi:MAG TPA: SDR family oxidoreductase [Thermomicrobiales bacterium]|nr:SDR family oxidoreductase [Thermomicrobiales bacterium]